VPCQYTKIFSDDFQHCSVLYPFFVVKILVQIKKTDVDHVFQIVRDLVSRQNIVDPFVLANVEDDPTCSPLSFDRVHFQLEINEQRKEKKVSQTNECLPPDVMNQNAFWNKESINTKVLFNFKGRFVFLVTVTLSKPLRIKTSWGKQTTFSGIHFALIVGPRQADH